jgi:hypothetical protein
MSEPATAAGPSTEARDEFRRQLVRFLDDRWPLIGSIMAAAEDYAAAREQEARAQVEPLLRAIEDSGTIWRVLHEMHKTWRGECFHAGRTPGDGPAEVQCVEEEKAILAALEGSSPPSPADVHSSEELREWEKAHDEQARLAQWGRAVLGAEPQRLPEVDREALARALWEADCGTLPRHIGTWEMLPERWQDAARGRADEVLAALEGLGERSSTYAVEPQGNGEPLAEPDTHLADARRTAIALMVREGSSDKMTLSGGSTSSSPPVASVTADVTSGATAGSRAGLNHRSATAGLTPDRDASDGLELRDVPSASSSSPPSRPPTEGDAHDQ